MVGVRDDTCLWTRTNRELGSGFRRWTDHVSRAVISLCRNHEWKVAWTPFKTSRRFLYCLFDCVKDQHELPAILLILSPLATTA